MRDDLKRRYEMRIVDDLLVLSGVRLEHFLHLLLDHLRPDLDWMHHGANLSGAPVKSIVDSMTTSGQEVGQFSSEEKYFAPGLAKPLRDIKQARSNHSNMRELLLFSNRRMPPSIETALRQLEADQLKLGLQVHTYDARRIAETVVKALHDDAFTEDVTAYLPTFAQLSGEFALSHGVPSDSEYVSRGALETVVKQKVKADRLVHLSGLSGVGKSALCAAVARDLRTEFHLVLWIDANGFSSPAALEAVLAKRRGISLNVMEVAKRNSVLLILDDCSPDFPLEDLLAKVHRDSAIVATSQLARPASISLDAVSLAETESILRRSSGLPTMPIGLAERVLKASSGHALAIRQLAAIAREEKSWSGVEQAAERPASLDAGDTKIYLRILQRHVPAMEQELRLLACAPKKKTFDSDLWRELFGPTSFRSCSRRAFLAPAPQNSVRAHDVVIASACEMFPDVAAGAFDERIERAVRQFLVQGRESLNRLAAADHSLLVEVLQRRPGSFILRAAVALVRDPKDVALLGDPEQLVRELVQRSSIEATDLRGLLESLDAIGHSLRKSKLSSPTFETIFATLKSHPALANELLRDVKHHEAKHLMFAKKSDNALEKFNALVQEWPAFMEGRLQIARELARKKDGPGAWVQIDAMMIAESLTPGSVPATVILSAVQLLGYNVMRPYVAGVFTNYEAVVRSALQRGFSVVDEVPYKALSALGYAWRVNPKAFCDLVDAVRIGPHELARGNSRFDWGQVLKAYAVAQRELGAAPHDVESLLQEALRFLENASIDEGFAHEQRASCLVDLRRFDEARKALDDVPEAERKHHWHHLSALALETTDAAAALALAQAAVSLVASNDPWRTEFEATCARIAGKLGA